MLPAKRHMSGPAALRTMISAVEPPGLSEKDLLPGRMMRDCMRCRAASASAACGVGGE